MFPSYVILRETQFFTYSSILVLHHLLTPTILYTFLFFFLMIRRPPRSTLSSSSAASDVYKRQYQRRVRGFFWEAMRVVLCLWLAVHCAYATPNEGASTVEVDQSSEQVFEEREWQSRFSQIWPGAEQDGDGDRFSKFQPRIGYVQELPGSFRVHLQVRTDTPSSKGVLLMLGPNDGDTGCDRNLRVLYEDADGGEGRFGVDLAGDAENAAVYTEDAFGIGQAYSLDVAYDGERSRLEIFVNGMPQSTSVREMPLPNKADISVLPACPGSTQFIGEIFDIRVFAGAAMPRPPFFSLPDKLTAARPEAAVLDSIPPRVRIHFRWRFEEGSGGGPLVLLGGSPGDCRLALQVSFISPTAEDPQGGIELGVEGRGPYALVAKGLVAGEENVVDCAYDHQLRQAKIYLNKKEVGFKQDLWGNDELGSRSLWNFPTSGGVSVLSSCHTNRKRVEGQISDVRIYAETQMVGGDEAVIACRVDQWSPWGKCSKTCGGGTARRERTVLVDARNGGAGCPLTHESRSCNTQGCTVGSCFEGGGHITPECTRALQSVLSVRVSGERNPVLGFGEGHQDGVGFPQDGELLDSAYANKMAKMGQALAMTPDWFYKPATEGAAARRKLLGVFLTDLTNNRILRWDAETNQGVTVLHPAVPAAALVAERGRPLPLSSIVVRRTASDTQVFFSAGPTIRFLGPSSGNTATVVGTGEYGECTSGVGEEVAIGGTGAMAVTPTGDGHSALVYADSGGALMVWDSKSSRVSTVAGKCGMAAHKDGAALGGARIGSQVRGIALDVSSSDDGRDLSISAVYFSDGDTIRRLQWAPAAEGVELVAVVWTELLSDENVENAIVVTLAGNALASGYKDSLPGAEGHLLFRAPASVHIQELSLIHISEPTRLLSISYAVFCLKKKKKKN
eukprot:TRINITY_DN993_c0_g1_i10.p1 TRINITY_DN993_c0_g1~~TRINITY_DN993_c0_g1_i10.p1  ORF type:complete len:905 (-),score=199.84 TRINITY_DN993_c0_g1_i10:85-2799(-)